MAGQGVNKDQDPQPHWWAGENPRAFSLSVMHTHMGLTLVLKIGTTVHQWGWPVCNMAFECMKCVYSRCSLWSWINVSFIVQLPGVMERGRETRRGRRRVQWCPLFRMPLGMPYPLLWRSSRLFQQVRTYVYVYRMFSVYWRKYQHAVYTTTILVSSDIHTCSFSVDGMPIDMYEHARTYVRT